MGDDNAALCMSYKLTLIRLDSQRGLKVTAIKRLILFILPAVLFGCAGFQTLVQPMQNIEDNDNQAYLTDCKTCMENLLRTDEAQKLKVNYYMSVEDAKNSQKTLNNNNVTDEDRINFIIYKNNLIFCREKLLDYYFYIDQRYVNVISEMYMKYDENLSMLLDEKITTGEYNNNYINLIQESKNMISNVNRIINTENLAAKKRIPMAICGRQLNSYDIQYLQQQKLLTQMTFKKLRILN